MEAQTEQPDAPFQRVKRAKLEPGDTFTVGSTEITFSTERE